MQGGEKRVRGGQTNNGDLRGGKEKVGIQTEKEKRKAGETQKRKATHGAEAEMNM